MGRMAPVKKTQNIDYADAILDNKTRQKSRKIKKQSKIEIVSFDEN